MKNENKKTIYINENSLENGSKRRIEHLSDIIKQHIVKIDQTNGYILFMGAGDITDIAHHFVCM